MVLEVHKLASLFCKQFHRACHRDEASVRVVLRWYCSLFVVMQRLRSSLRQPRRYQSDSPVSLPRHNRCGWVGLATARNSFSHSLGLTAKRALGYIAASPPAKVAELADAQDSGTKTHCDMEKLRMW